VLSTNAFIGRADKPTDDDLCQALGPAKPFWDRLIADLAVEYNVADLEWKSYSRKAGWSLRISRGKRTIVWMSPLENRFQVTFILGDKAMQAARAGKLSASLQKILDESKKYPEGTGVRLDIEKQKDLAAVKKLAAVKLAN
jgi:hypothetical protein